VQDQSTDLWSLHERGKLAMVPIDSDDDIQSDASDAIPRGVLSQLGGDLSDTRGEVHPYHQITEVSPLYESSRLMPLAVTLLPSIPPRVIADLPQVKLRLPKPDVNGRFDRRDDLRFSKGDPEHTEQRSDHGAVTLWFYSLGKQQARPGAIL
jgi:hypothetical protein